MVIHVMAAPQAVSDQLSSGVLGPRAARAPSSICYLTPGPLDVLLHHRRIALNLDISTPVAISRRKATAQPINIHLYRARTCP
mgnify:CR=1 FL=1